MQGEYRLFLFQHPKKLHYLTSSSRSIPYRLNYTLSLPPDTLGFDFSIPGAGENSYFVERNRENDSIQIWLTDSSLYSQQIISSVDNLSFYRHCRNYCPEAGYNPDEISYTPFHQG